MVIGSRPLSGCRGVTHAPVSTLAGVAETYLQGALSMADLKQHSPIILPLLIPHATLPEAWLAGTLGVHSQQEGPVLPPHPLPEAGGVAVVQASCPDQRVVDRAHTTHPAERGRQEGGGELVGT